MLGISACVQLQLAQPNVDIVQHAFSCARARAPATPRSSAAAGMHDELFCAGVFSNRDMA